MTKEEKEERAMKVAQAVIDSAFAISKALDGVDLSELGKDAKSINRAIKRAAKKASNQINQIK
jgi:hypothetical protein